MIRFRLFPLILAGLFLLGGSALAQPDSLNVSRLVHKPLGWGTVSWSQPAARGDTAFIPQGHAGVGIFDLSDPASPAEIGRIERANAIGFALQGTLGCLWTEEALFFYDMSDPAHPVFTGHWESGPSSDKKIDSVTLIGTVAYVGELYYDELWLVDASDPANPDSVHTLSLGPSNNRRPMAAQKDNTLIVTGDSIRFYDNTDPLSPVHLASYRDGAGEPSMFRIGGDVLYVRTGTGGDLHAVNIADIHNPDSLGTFHLNQPYYGLEVKGELVLVRSERRVDIVDFTDPMEPFSASNIFYDFADALSYGGTASGSDWYLASTGSPFELYSWGEDTALVRETRQTNRVRPVRTAARGSIVYLLESSGLLHAYDISNPADVSETASLLLPYSTSGGMEFYDDLAYVAADELLVLDLSNPGHPVLAAEIPVRDVASDVSLWRGILTVTTGSNLYLYDLVTPLRPVLLDSIAHTSYNDIVRSAIHKTGVTLLRGGNVATVWDIADPANPTQSTLMRTSLSTPGTCLDFATGDDMMIFADGGGGTLPVDMTVPRNPDMETPLDAPPEASDTRFALYTGQHAFMVHDGWGLQVVNATDPTNLTEAGNYYSDLTYARPGLHDHRLALASDEYLDVFDISAFQQQPRPLQLLSHTPGDTVTLSEFDLRWSTPFDPDGDPVNGQITLAFDPAMRDVLFSVPLEPLPSEVLLQNQPEDSTLYIQVSLVDGVTDSLHLPAWALHVAFPEPPSPFALAGNVRGDTVTALPDTLCWHPSVDPDPGDSVRYEVWVDTLATMQTRWRVASALADTFCALPELDDDHDYWWTVYAKDGFPGTTRPASDTLQLRVEIPQTPEGFALAAPASGTGGLWGETTFAWHATSDPDPGDSVRYRFCMETVEGASWSLSDLEDTTLTINPIDTLGLMQSTTLAWWVEAISFAPEDTLACDEPFTLVLTAAGVGEPAGLLPEQFALESVRPNPFNPSTYITVAMPEAAELTLQVYNVLGRRIAELARGRYAAGRHRFLLDGGRLASGVYIVRAAVPGETVQQRRVVLMK